jgi:hypothetical protein
MRLLLKPVNKKARKGDKMLLGAFIGMAIAAWFGAPLLPIILLGACLQIGAAYVLTKNMTMLRIGFGLLIVTAGQYLILPMLEGSGQSIPFSPAVFTGLAYAVGVISLIVATIVGVMGRDTLKASAGR